MCVTKEQSRGNVPIPISNGSELSSVCSSLLQKDRTQIEFEVVRTSASGDESTVYGKFLDCFSEQPTHVSGDRSVAFNDLSFRVSFASYIHILYTNRPLIR